MNILLIHNYYKVRGGEDTVFNNEYEALKNQGINVIKYTRDNKEIDNFNLLMKLKFFISSFNNKKTVKDLNKILSKNKFDIAHVHNVFPLISPNVYGLLKKYGIKVIQTIHNYRFLCPNGLFFINGKNCRKCLNGRFGNCIKYRCFKNSLLLSWLYSSIIKKNQYNFKNNIDIYIALTDFVKKIFIDSGYDKKKIYIKDNGFIDKKLKRSESKGYFLYLGRISKEKGINFLLDSFIVMNKYILKIAGLSPDIDEYKTGYAHKNIEFIGYIDGSEKERLIREAIALILPSEWFENYPMVIVEAFSYGIPVIASNIGGIPYIIEDGVNGFLFDTGDASSLNEKLDKLYNNPKLRNKMGDNARSTFLSRMENNKNIKKLIDIYKDVLQDVK